VWAPPCGVPLVQLDRLDPQVTRALLMVLLSPLGGDVLEAVHGLDVDPTEVSGPCVTDAPALTLQQPLPGLRGPLGAFHPRPPTRGELLPTRLAAPPLEVLVLAGPRAVGDGAGPLRAPTGAAQIGTRACALVLTLWRERGIRHGIGLPMGIGTDAANFPSDFNFPVVIFLDYQISRASCAVNFLSCDECETKILGLLTPSTSVLLSCSPTLGMSCCRKQERGTSVRWRQSAPYPC
jgi:hypothetical protein